MLLHNHGKVWNYSKKLNQTPVKMDKLILWRLDFIQWFSNVWQEINCWDRSQVTALRIRSTDLWDLLRLEKFLTASKNDCQKWPLLIWKKTLNEATAFVGLPSTCLRIIRKLIHKKEKWSFYHFFSTAEVLPLIAPRQTFNKGRITA